MSNGVISTLKSLLWLPLPLGRSPVFSPCSLPLRSACLTSHRPSPGLLHVPQLCSLHLLGFRRAVPSPWMVLPCPLSHPLAFFRSQPKCHSLRKGDFLESPDQPLDLMSRPHLVDGAIQEKCICSCFLAIM